LIEQHGLIGQGVGVYFRKAQEPFIRGRQRVRYDGSGPLNARAGRSVALITASTVGGT
jgi:hypothetical protein